MRIRDPEWKKIRIRDLGWKKVGSGINIPDYRKTGWIRKTNLLGGRAEAGAGGGGGGPPGRRGGQPTETESGCRTGRETSREEQANPGKLKILTPQ
jgi:hypothetical protein